MEVEREPVLGRQRVEVDVQPLEAPACIEAAIGTSATPTPTGTYYVNQRLVPTDPSPADPGLLESTRAHTAYHGVIVILLLVSAVLTAFA